MATLLDTLQEMYATGSIDFSQLGISSLPTLFTGAGQPSVLNLNSGSQWTDALTFTGTSSTTLFGVSNPSVYMQFVSDGSGSYWFLLDVALPNSWLLSDGVSQLAGTLAAALPLSPSNSGPQPWAMILSSGALSDPLRQQSGNLIQVAPGVSLFAQFDAAAGPLADLDWLQQITTPALNLGVWSFSNGAYAANPAFSLNLVNIQTDSILPSGDQLNVQMTVVCSEVSNQMEAGIGFSATLSVGSTAVTVTATWSSTATTVIPLQVQGLTIPLPTDQQLASIFGSGVSVSSVVPVKFSGSIDVALLEFDLDLQAKALKSVELTLSGTAALSLGPFSLSGMNLSVIWVKGASLSASLTATGTISQQGASIVVALTGAYQNAGYSFTSQLQGNPTLPTVATAIFGSDAPSGLPATVEITTLDFNADISGSSYTMNCAFSGTWQIPGTNITFESLGLQVADPTSLSGTLSMQWTVGNGQNFSVTLTMAAGTATFEGLWSAASTADQITFVDIATALGITDVPPLPAGLNFALQSATLSLDSSVPDIDFSLTTAGNTQAGMYAAKSGGNWGFVFGMALGLSETIDLSNIPVIGDLVPSNLNSLAIDNLRIVAATSTVVQPPASQQSIFGNTVNSGIAAAIDLTIGTAGTKTITFSTNSGSGGQQALALAAGVADDDSSNSAAPQTGWLTVQRSFGPLSINKIGFSLGASTTVEMFLDATVTLGPLALGFTGLEASMALQPPGTPSFGLQGLELSCQGAVTIQGGLLFETASSPATYSGNVLVKAANFTILGLGLYIDSSPPALSGFFFLSADLGGPPAFFVTGLAGGFGYNTQLLLPAISDVATFPLVAGATGQLDESGTKAALSSVVQEQMNEYWLAFGIQFSSFELISTFVLLTLEFGAEFEIALLGESTISFPPPGGEESSTPIAQAQMVVEATLQPSIGQLAVNAQLTPASYVLDKAAQLSGGFAYYQWFGSSAYAGDFVVTLGGYNPYWTPPTYYPTVPRLGLNWSVSTELSVAGNLYFALTPSMLMAGGSLSATWNSGPISAWFDAEANFLVRFQPFTYSANMSVSIGASFSVSILGINVSMTVHVGVSLQLWGPPFGGTASVDLSVISFTISFGSNPPGPPTVLWGDFASNYLPQSGGTSCEQSSRKLAFRALHEVMALAAGPPPPAAPSPLVTISAADGLIANSGNFMQLDPLTFVLNIGVQVPGTSVSVNGGPVVSSNSQGQFAALGIGPMGLGAGSVTAPITITIDWWNDSTGAWVQDTQTWNMNPTVASVAAGLWANTNAQISNPNLVTNALVGLALVPAAFNPDATLPVSISVLLVAPATPIMVDLEGAAAPNWSGEYQTVWQEVQTTAVTPLVLAQSAVLASLAAQGLGALPASIDLAAFMQEAPAIYTAAPVLAGLGANQ